MGGGGLGKITKVVKKPFKKVVSSIKKTLKNPLSLPERFFKNGIIKPIKQAGKEALRFTARATREVFSVLSRHTGLKFFDKIGDGSYLFTMAIKSGDWRAIGAAVMVSLSILATIFSYGALSELVGASMAYALSAANISMAAINFGVNHSF